MGSFKVITVHYRNKSSFFNFLSTYLHNAEKALWYPQSRLRVILKIFSYTIAIVQASF